MNEFGVSDEHRKKVRERQQFEIEVAKENFAPWLRESRDNFVDYQRKSTR